MSDVQEPVRMHLRHLKLEGKSPVTIYHRERALARLAAALAPCPLAEATADMLYEWRAGLNVAGPTVAGYVSHVQGFYEWALSRSYVAANPAGRIPVPPVPRRLPHPISEEDLAAAMECASGRVRIWLIFAGWCGLRAKEIAGLRAENLCLRGEHPHVLVVLETTKGRIEHRIPVCPSAAAELAAARLPAIGLLFRRADGAPLRPWMVSKLCNEHLHDLGIASTLHDLRARFATRSYEVNHDIRSVQEMLGHARVETTVIYTYVGQAAQAAIVGAIPPVPGRRRVA